MDDTMNELRQAAEGARRAVFRIDALVGGLSPEAQLAVMREAARQLGPERVIEAMETYFPPEQWPRIRALLDEPE